MITRREFGAAASGAVLAPEAAPNSMRFVIPDERRTVTTEDLLADIQQGLCAVCTEELGDGSRLAYRTRTGTEEDAMLHNLQLVCRDCRGA